MLNPSIDILQSGKNTARRNRRLAICLLRDIVPTGRRRKMDTNSIPIKGDETGRIQLRRTRQRAISNSSSAPGMEAIPPRKRTTLQSLNRPPEHDKIYDHQGVNRTANPMESSFEQLPLQNQISTRKRRMQARCLNSTKTRHATGRR